MSIVNVWLSPTRALVAADTHTKNVLTGKISEGSKMLALPHAGAVIGHRGHNVFLSTVFSLSTQRSDVVDFDTLCAAMPDMLQTTHNFIYSNLPVDQRDSMAAQEFLIVGHSGGRISCKVFARQDMQLGFIESDIEDPGYVGCWDMDWGYPPEDIGTPEGMSALVQIQTKKHREMYPNEAIGGRLLLAEVTQAGITFTQLGDALKAQAAR
ncbi:MAG: hypothetical protein Q7T78_04425 [Rhodoferax sp.]|nr:hypothetical protein [Rhodoferax sp.]